MTNLHRSVSAGLFAGGLLLLIGVLITTSVSSEDTTAGWLQTLRDHPDATQIADLFLHFGWVLIAPAAAGLAWLAWKDGGWSVRVGAAFAVLGLTTIPGLMATDAYDTVLAQEVGGEEAVRLSEQAQGELVAAVIAGTGAGGAALGLLFLLLGARRAGLVPWAAPALILAGLIAPLTTSDPAAGAVGSVCVFAALALAAATLIRSPRALQPAAA